jgi:SAM-dependent methyltransferase
MSRSLHRNVSEHLDLADGKKDFEGSRSSRLMGAFDLVVSSNGFFVWVSDLDAVFSSVHRVLRPGGHYMFYDIHPFNRPWEQSGARLVMMKTYWETGPQVTAALGPTPSARRNTGGNHNA